MMLSDICLSVTYIGNNSRTKRPRKNKIGPRVAHVTRDSDTTFRIQRSRSPYALLSTALTHKAAAAVSVGMNSAWDSTATLRLFVDARGAWAPMGEQMVGAYCVATRTACCCLKILVLEETQKGKTMQKSEARKETNNAQSDVFLCSLQHTSG